MARGAVPERTVEVFSPKVAGASPCMVSQLTPLQPRSTVLGWCAGHGREQLSTSFVPPLCVRPGVGDQVACSGSEVDLGPYPGVMSDQLSPPVFVERPRSLGSALIRIVLWFAVARVPVSLALALSQRSADTDTDTDTSCFFRTAVAILIGVGVNAQCGQFGANGNGHTIDPIFWI
jgi:hypothetical protein